MSTLMYMTCLRLCNRCNSMKQVTHSHSITEGQPYEGVFTLGYYLDVRAGRHGSEEVARDFNAGITPDNAKGLGKLRFSVICL